MNKRRIDIDPNTGRLRITFEYDAELVKTVRSLPQRRWDPNVRAWFVPKQHLEQVWRTLSALHFNLSDELRALGDQKTTTLPPSVTGLHADEVFSERLDTTINRVSLADLNQRVQDTIRSAFPTTVWVIGELSEWNPGRRPTIYFELIEQNAQQNGTVAKASAIIFPRARAQLEETLKSVGGAVALSNGVQVCLKARVDLYPAGGRYQLIVEGIDPGYTLGRLSQKRDMILRQLDAQGLLGLNRRRPITPLPLRVGLITSSGSHAYSDIINELQLSRFGFEVFVYNARMQGHFLESTVLEGLEYFRHTAAAEKPAVDVVAIVRGGGARTDLAWFDTIKLATAVAKYPIPVLIGIGHQRDVSVLDDVARSFKTPTAVARFLNVQVTAVVESLDDLQERLRGSTSPHISQQKAQLRFTAQQLARESRHRLSDGYKSLRHFAEQLATMTGGHVRASDQHLERLRKQLPKATDRCLEDATSRLGFIEESRLSSARLLRDTQRRVSDVRDLQRRLDAATTRALRRHRTLLGHNDVRRKSLDPERLLERGYVIIHALNHGQKPRLVRSSHELNDRNLFRFTFADGATIRKISAPEEDNEISKEPS